MRSPAATPCLALLLVCAAASASAAVNSFDENAVFRPKSWGAVFRPDVELSDHTKVDGAVYGTGIAKGYVEECPSTNKPPEGHSCYRVYLVLDPKVASNVYALYGSSYADLTLQTDDGSDFYQAPPGLDVELGGVNPALFQFVPIAEFDSWLSIGADSGDTQSQLSVVGLDKFANTSMLSTNNGALFASDPGSVPDSAQKPSKLGSRASDAVLIGQLTLKSSSSFTWVLNAQGRSGQSVSGNTWQEHGICITTSALDNTCGRHVIEAKKSFVEKDEL